MTRDIDLVVEMTARAGDRIVALFRDDCYVDRAHLTSWAERLGVTALYREVTE